MLSYIKLFFIIIHIVICSVLALLFAIFDRSHHLYFKLSKFFSWGVLFLSGVKLNITGLGYLEKGKPYIFVSNHSSQFDIPALQFAFPQETSIVFKKNLEKFLYSAGS